MQARNTTSVSVGTSDTPIALQTNDYDPWSTHSTSVNNTRFTAPVGGVYALNGSIAVTDSGSTISFWGGYHYNGGFVNGSLVTGPPGVAGISRVWTLPRIIQTMSVGDFVEMFAAGSTAGTTQAGSGHFSTFVVEYIHA